MIDPNNPDFADTPVSSSRPEFQYSPFDASAVPAVSIITPFYNAGQVFHETARSVLLQSLQQWEWLIINDGSSELESIATLEQYRHLDSRIRVIDLPSHLGVSAARNTGFREANARYVLQLDSDDLLEPTAAEKWIWFLETHAESAFTNGYSVGFGAQEYVWSRGFEESATFLQENVVQTTALIRKKVHSAIGGYDESISSGMEDWDFWLNCAAHGYWGQSVPEHLYWYRRRPSPQDRWSSIDSGEQQRLFHKKLRDRYPILWRKAFPAVQTPWHTPYAPVLTELPFVNVLSKTKQRLLMVVPWLSVGGADKFNLDLMGQLCRRGWEVTVAATAPGDSTWEHEFGRFTPDIFLLNRFLRLLDFPRFLRYLIGSRQPDVVMISNSELGYLLLPYLRAHCPEPVYVDFCHMEEELWKNGGFPRKSLVYQEQLDLSIVASNHLKQWMVRNEGQEARIDVCYINVDPTVWRPDPIQRTVSRRKLRVSEEIPMLLFVGRLTQQKQPLVMVRVLEQLANTGHQFVAIVIGDGPERARIEQFVHERGLGTTVKILGGLPSAKVRQYMQSADVFFLPSECEGVALTMYEAMACGLAVVGADVGGQRELVLAECGVLVPHADEDSDVANYVNALAELMVDPARYRKLGQAGRDRIQNHFRTEQMTYRMLALFEKAGSLRDLRLNMPTQPGLGDIAAQEAIESMRLFYLSEDLWHEREQWRGLRPGTRRYLKMRKLLLPIYTRVGGNNLKWALAAKQGLKRIMQA